MKKVFLGGTCNNSTWRDELIPMLEVPYFNPVVADWTPECQAEELRQRESCDYCLYVITPEMTGVYSIAEATDDSNKRPYKTLFCFLPEANDKEFNKDQIRSLQATSNLIKENGAKVFESLKEVAEWINSSHLIPSDSNLTYRYSNDGGFGYEEWVNSDGNVIHYKDSDEEKWFHSNGNIAHHIQHSPIDGGGYEEWYNEDGNVIHYKDSYEESWYEYDKNGNRTYEKNSNGTESWLDSNERVIRKKWPTGLEVWYEYHSNGKVKHYKKSHGYEGWYDEEENVIHVRYSDGEEYWYDSDGNIIDAKTSTTTTN